MAQSPFPNAEGRVSTARTDFTLDHHSLFTSPVGMILPTYVEDVCAGDYLDLSVHNVTRMQGVNTAAFAGFDEKTDFFFVPYRLLLSWYPQMKVGASVQFSSLAPTKIDGYFPNLTRLQLETGVCATYNRSDQFGYPIMPSAQRLLDLLGYGTLKPLTAPSSGSLVAADGKKILSGNSSHKSMRVNIFRLLAYHCIYQHYYRNTDFEAQDNFFNVDKYFSTGAFSLGSQLNDFIVQLVTPHYKNWKQDLFTSIKPYNGISSYGSQNTTLKAGLQSVAIQSGYGQTFGRLVQDDNAVGDAANDSMHSGNVNLEAPVVTDSADDQSAMLTASDMRALMHMDAFTRRAIMSEKTYSSLLKALYGIDDSLKDTPVYLGTHASQINISEVVGTAAGSSDNNESYLGQIGGRGIGSDASHVFSKQFDEDGVVIGMHYFAPYNNYGTSRISKMNTHLNRWDMPIPDFDNLGLAPVFQYEFFTSTNTSNSFNSDRVMGYNTRYHEYKQRVDELHGEFADGGSLEGWTIQNNQTESFDGTPTEFLRLIKIKPSVANSIMKLAYNGYQGYDPFMCWVDYNVKRSSNISRTGLPNNGL